VTAHINLAAVVKSVCSGSRRCLHVCSCCGCAAVTATRFLLTLLSPRSGHCKQLAPKWRKLAEALHGVVKVAAVNCEQQQAVCQEHGVRGYPTIKAFRCACCFCLLLEQLGSTTGVLRNLQQAKLTWLAVAQPRAVSPRHGQLGCLRSSFAVCCCLLRFLQRRQITRVPRRSVSQASQRLGAEPAA
jgi:thiol-disulfide isomerase/thioredoxin